MNMNEFSNILAGRLKEYGITAAPTESHKNNGIVQYGLTLRRGDERVCPIIYLNHFAERFKNGQLNVDDILNQIIVEYEKLPVPDLLSLEAQMESPDFITQIQLRLVNAEKNKSMIRNRNLVFHEIGDTDLVVIFYFTCIEDGEASGSVALTEQLMERYLPDVEDGDELYELIVSRKDNNVSVESINEVIARMAAEKSLMLPPIADDFLYVVTNRANLYGAGAVLTEEACKLIVKHFPDACVTILPSSVHEVLVLETKEDEDLDALRDMVHCVNHSELEPQDILSENVFHYNAKTRELTIAE